MKDEPGNDPQNAQTRRWLRALGPIMLIGGVIFMIVGFANFFASFGSFEPPRLFWCFFAGIPLIFLGVVLSGAGYLVSPAAMVDRLNARLASRVKPCPYCSARNRLGASSCERCGAPLKDER